MDLTQLLGTFMQSGFVNGVSSNTNASSGDITKILGAALPLLLKGAQSQTNNKKTSAGFLQALTDHSKDDTSDLKAFGRNADLEDGAKIVAHLLGKNSGSTINEVAKTAGVSANDTAKVMAAAAPLLMSMLGKETQTQAKTQKTAASTDMVSALMGNLVQNADMGSILGGLLGGGSSAGVKKNDDTAAMLGSILKMLNK